MICSPIPINSQIGGADHEELASVISICLDNSRPTMQSGLCPVSRATSILKQPPLADSSLKKRVSFGKETYHEDDAQDWSSLDQAWWGMKDLKKNVEKEVALALTNHPDSETRGLEYYLGEDADQEREKNRMYIRCVVHKAKRLARAAARTKSTHATDVLQKYAAHQTHPDQLKAWEMAKWDEAWAREIYGVIMDVYVYPCSSSQPDVAANQEMMLIGGSTAKPARRECIPKGVPLRTASC